MPKNQRHESPSFDHSSFFRTSSFGCRHSATRALSSRVFANASLVSAQERVGAASLCLPRLSWVKAGVKAFPCIAIEHRQGGTRCSHRVGPATAGRLYRLISRLRRFALSSVRAGLALSGEALPAAASLSDAGVDDPPKGFRRSKR